MSDLFLDVFFASGIILVWTLVLAIIKNQMTGSDKVVEALRQRIKELREELRQQKEHYERLLRDAAIKNVMMRGLWDAFRSGKLEECYRDNGNVRVLADGTVICRQDPEDKSYVLSPTERKLPEVKFRLPESMPEVEEEVEEVGEYDGDSE